MQYMFGYMQINAKHYHEASLTTFSDYYEEIHGDIKKALT